MDHIETHVERALNAELARRLLIQFFYERGFTENFDSKVYPPMLQEMVTTIPQLNGKLEVIPHALEINPQTGFARIGWNLFVLGNQRMYLGETEHGDMKELARQLDSGFIGQNITMSEDEGTEVIYRQGRSARDIINYIIKVLKNNDAGIIRTSENIQPNQVTPFGAAARNPMYDRPKTIRPEGTNMMR